MPRAERLIYANLILNTYTLKNPHYVEGQLAFIIRFLRNCLYSFDIRLSILLINGERRTRDGRDYNINYETIMSPDGCCRSLEHVNRVLC